MLTKRQCRKVCRDLGMGRKEFNRAWKETLEEQEPKNSFGKYAGIGTLAGLSMAPFALADGPAPIVEKTKGEKPLLDFKLGTLQAGLTSDGVIKDRVITSGNVLDFVAYKGLYECLQNDKSLLDETYLRNELHLKGIGSRHITPITVMKVKEDNGKMKLKDFKYGISNSSILEELFGNGKIYLTTDTKELTGFFNYNTDLSSGFNFDLTGEGTFKSGEKPSLYIEAELQKYVKDGVYVFARGEIDNGGYKNIIIGVGITPKK